MKTKSISLRTYILSIACVIHCLGLPILIAVAPIFGNIFANPFAEMGFLITSILAGVFIVYKSYCSHKKIHAFILFALGAMLWISHSVLEFYEIDGAKIYFYIGTLLVLVSYYVSHRLLKCCSSECSDN